MKVHLIENSTVNVDNEVINLGDLAITQGLSYYLTYYIKGNYTSWIPKGQIRTTYYESGGVLETEFNFDSNLYLESEDITFIRPFLKANITKDLIATNYQNRVNEVPSVENCFLYSMILINPSDADDVHPLVDTSFVQIKPSVTIYNSNDYICEES